MNATVTVVKVCLRCGEEKSLAQFHKNKRKADGLDIYCKSCNNERIRARYHSDESVRAEKIAATRAYHLANPEWSKDRQRASHVAHRDERYARAVERGNDPAVRQQRRDSSRRSEQRRRAIKAAAEVVESISPTQLSELLLMRYFGQCYICGADFSADVALHWDHFKPLAKGGNHSIDNLRPACDLCNVRKNATWPVSDERLAQIATEVRALRKRIASSQGRG